MSAARDPRRIPFVDSNVVPRTRYRARTSLRRRAWLAARDVLRRYFLDPLNPARNARRLRWHWQRLRRGWSDRDAWSLDTHLAEQLRDGLLRLAEISHGWPEDLFVTFEDYVAELRWVAGAFDHYLRAQTFEESCTCCEQPYCRESIECPIIAEGFERLARVFPTLWD